MVDFPLEGVVEVELLTYFPPGPLTLLNGCRRLIEKPRLPPVSVNALSCDETNGAPSIAAASSELVDDCPYRSSLEPGSDTLLSVTPAWS